jgi:hypothetical protein
MISAILIVLAAKKDEWFPALSLPRQKVRHPHVLDGTFERSY